MLAIVLRLVSAAKLRNSSKITSELEHDSVSAVDNSFNRKALAEKLLNCYMKRGIVALLAIMDA
jgi:hypothetical protein